MAKKKTAGKELTPKEKLARAIVPAGQQPYKIPENWCWTYIRNVSEVVTGGTPSKKNPNYYGGNFPFFKPADLNAGRYTYNASEYLSDEGKTISRIVPQGSTAVCCIGSIGKCGFLETEGATNQQINVAIPKFNPLYLFYFCNTICFINQLWEKSAATTISIVNKSKMESCKIPLASLPEQQRIADRLDRMFDKLDAAKEKLQSVLDRFERRKYAILHKAFTGELIGKSDVPLVLISQITDDIRIGPFGSLLHKDDYIQGGIPVINPKHIVSQKIIPQDKIRLYSNSSGNVKISRVI